MNCDGGKSAVVRCSGCIESISRALALFQRHGPVQFYIMKDAHVYAINYELLLWNAFARSRACYYRTLNVQWPPL